MSGQADTNVWSPTDATPALAEAWRWSNTQLDRLAESLNNRLDGVDTVRCVAACGSLGRLEASSHSDADLLVVLQDDVSCDESQARDASDRVAQAVRDVGFEASKPGGVFAQPTSLAALADPKTRGLVADDPVLFAQRLHVLLDARSAYRPDAFEAVRESVLDRTIGPFGGAGWRNTTGIHPWEYLLNDLRRHRAAGLAWRQWDFDPQRGGWGTRQAKMRHSRLIEYVALTWLLAESTLHGDDARAWVTQRLRLTPMQRLAAVYDARGDEGFEQVAVCMERFVRAMADPRFRDELAESPVPAGDDATGSSLTTVSLQHAEGLSSLLTEFLLRHAGAWDARVVATMVL